MTRIDAIASGTNMESSAYLSQTGDTVVVVLSNSNEEKPINSNTEKNKFNIKAIKILRSVFIKTPKFKVWVIKFLEERFNYSKYGQLWT